MATLGLDVCFFIGIEVHFVEHLFLELGARILVTVDFGRISLTSLSSAHALSLPVAFGERRIAIFVSIGELVV